MVVLAKIIGILIALLGIASAVYPDWMKKMMAFWKQDNRFYYGGVIRFAIGVVLLIASGSSTQAATAVILGLIFLLGGSVIYVLGAEPVKKEIEFWESQSDLALRLMAAFIFLFGSLVFFAV